MIKYRDALKARKRLLKMHHESGVGHIGGNLSVLDCLLVLTKEFMQIKNDIILSKGHSAGALYIALWYAGHIKSSELRTFHKDDTNLPGHPPINTMMNVPFGTGSLGHGLSLASGNALATRIKKNNGHTYCVMSDGEWQEGSTWEALIFASHHKLNNLTIFIDNNKLQGFGNTSEIASMDPLITKLDGFDLKILEIDGHNHDQIREAAKLRSKKPILVCMNTIKGKGISFMENKMEWHYLPLDPKHYKIAIDELNI